MSAFNLLCAIRDFLSPRLATLPMAARTQQNRLKSSENLETMAPCRVYIGSMPATMAEAQAAAPFVVIQAMDGEGTAEGLENIRVVLRLCVMNDEREAAENDLLNLVSELRLWLMEMPGGALAARYRLMPADESVLPWERPDEQLPPFLQAHIFTRWQTRAAVKRPGLKMVDYE